MANLDKSDAHHRTRATNPDRTIKPTFLILTSDLRSADLPVTNNQNLSVPDSCDNHSLVIFALKMAYGPWARCLCRNLIGRDTSPAARSETRGARRSSISSGPSVNGQRFMSDLIKHQPPHLPAPLAAMRSTSTLRRGTLSTSSATSRSCSSTSGSSWRSWSPVPCWRVLKPP